MTIGLVDVALLSLVLLVAEVYRLRQQVKGLRQEVRTRRLVIEDEIGARARLFVGRDGLALTLSGEHGPCLSLTDESGPCLKLTDEGSGPCLRLTDENGKTRALLYGQGLELLNEKGQKLAALEAGEDGSRLTLLDENPKASVDLGAKGGVAELVLYDEDGPRAELTLTEDGPELTLRDENDQTRAALGWCSTVRKVDGVVETHPESSLVLFDKDGKVLKELP